MAEDLHGLKVDARKEGPLGLVRLQGDVRSDRIHLLTAAVEDLETTGTKDVVLDLGGVTFVDSASIGVVVRLNGDLASKGGRIVLHSVPRVARKVLEVTGLDTRITVAKNEAEARKRLSGS